MKRASCSALLGALAAAALAAGCEGTDGERVSNVAETASLSAVNGLTLNGLVRNGLCRNGLESNGLARNGLTPGGLAAPEFSAWFNSDAAQADNVMRFVARCALKNSSALAWRNPMTGRSYVWQGQLGLAPYWAGGAPATEPEQQIVTACLVALVNKYGRELKVSLQGRSASGAPIPLEPFELFTYGQPEGCFFGNLFTDEGVYAGLDHGPLGWPLELNLGPVQPGSWGGSVTSVRACALDPSLNGTSAACPPIYQFGYCWTRCSLDRTGSFFERCSWNGRTYRPITTQIRKKDVYRCGDGVCQFTERCGTTFAASACIDCGRCR